MRTLTHKLEYNKETDRWSCRCGYVLGTGHDELYAQCPLTKRYIESDITQPTKKRRTSKRPSKAALDLFDI
jgi:hypothetical protein